MFGTIILFMAGLMIIGLLLFATTLAINDFEKRIQHFMDKIKGRYETFPKTLTLDQLLNRK